MEFKVNSTELNKGLSKLYPVINTKSPVDLYLNFLVEIADGVMTMYASDVEMVLCAKFDIINTEETTASFLINANLIYDIVRSLKDTQITFSIIEGKQATLTTPSGTYNLNILDRDNYPLNIPNSAPTDIKVTMNGKRIKEIFDNSLYVIGENTKQSMMGLAIDFKDDGLRIVSTDGYRLVKHTLTDIKLDSPLTCVVPKKSVVIVSKILEEKDFEVVIDKTYITFNTDQFTLYSRLIADKFPNYDAVIPLDNELRMKVSKVQLHDAVKRMLIFANYSDNKKVLFTFGVDNVEISAIDVNNSFSAKENVQCKYTGLPLEIGFNCVHLNDMLSHINSDDELVFKIKEATKPLLVSLSENKPDEDLLVLIMPMRLNKKNDSYWYRINKF